MCGDEGALVQVNIYKRLQIKAFTCKTSVRFRFTLRSQNCYLHIPIFRCYCALTNSLVRLLDLPLLTLGFICLNPVRQLVGFGHVTGSVKVASTDLLGRKAIHPHLVVSFDKQ